MYEKSPRLTRSQGTCPLDANIAWKIPVGTAISLIAKGPGILRIDSGQAWVTRNRDTINAAFLAGLLRCEDDLFLAAGSCLPLQTGQGLVLEAYSPGAAAGLSLTWQPAVATSTAQRWQRTVARPAAELRRSLAVAGVALWAFAVGLCCFMRGSLNARQPTPVDTQ